MPKTSQRKHRQSRFEEGIRPFRYRFYAEMSHWDEKKLTRYRAKAGPEVVLRKVSVLFAISSMPKTSHKGRQGKVVLRRVPALFVYRECRIFLRCFTYIVHREESRYGQKADFGPAKPVGRSQTWPVEAFCPYLLSSKEDT